MSKIKKLSLILGIVLVAIIGVAGCSKNIDGTKVYETKIEKISAQENGLIKITGTSSAPNGATLFLVNSEKATAYLSNTQSGTKIAKVSSGKFTAYTTPYYFDSMEKGDSIDLYLVAIEPGKISKNDVQKKTKKAINLTKKISEKFSPYNFKINFDPKTESVRMLLGEKAKIERKSSSVFAVIPKEGTKLEEYSVNATYGDLSGWNDVTSTIDTASELSESTIVLLNPGNTSLKIYSAKNGETTYDAITDSFGDSTDEDADDDSDSSEDTTEEETTEEESTEDTTTEDSVDEPSEEDTE